MTRTPNPARGTVALLNVGDGDTTLSFDPSKPAERLRAARIVADMLKRGYALMVKEPDGAGGDHWRRVQSFDETRCEYLIADFDSAIAREHDQQEDTHGHQPQEIAPAATSTEPAAGPPAKRSYRVRRVDAGRASTVAVAPIAGG